MPEVKKTLTQIYEALQAQTIDPTFWQVVQPQLRILTQRGKPIFYRAFRKTAQGGEGVKLLTLKLNAFTF